MRSNFRKYFVDFLITSIALLALLSVVNLVVRIENGFVNAVAWSASLSSGSIISAMLNDAYKDNIIKILLHKTLILAVTYLALLNIPKLF